MENKHTVKLVKVHWERVGNRAFEPESAEVVFCTPAAAANNLRRNKGKPNPLWMDVSSARQRGIKIEESEEVEAPIEPEFLTEVEVVEEVKATPRRRRPKAKKNQ